jgi:hypothetical protein
MNRILFIICFLSTFTGRCYTPDIFYEWFSLGGGFIYSMEDQYTGLNGKINLPLGSHAKFVMQATLFPEQLQDPSQAYNEARAKFNVEFIPIKFKKVYLSVQTGFDYGYWQRNFVLPGSTLKLNWKKDESMMFGAIMNYDFHRYRFYIDYMYMPEIFSNHVGLGIAILFFEDDVYRRKYLQRKHVNSKKRKSSRKNKNQRKNTIRKKNLNKS